MEILSGLIDSQSKARLMAKILDRPNAVFSVSELGRLSDLSKASVSVIITQWERTGLVLSRRQGRNKLVSLNRGFYLLPELQKISEKAKDFQKPLVDMLLSLPVLKSHKVKAIVLFGSRARKDFSNFSDLDVLIGVEKKDDPIAERISEEFVHATTRSGVRFSPVVLAKSEIRERRKEKDHFLQNILSEGKIIAGAKWLERIQTAP